MENYAIIENGIVTNICVADYSILKHKNNYVCLGTRAVGIGDEYRNGKFYHEGIEIKTDLEILEEENNELNNVLSIITGVATDDES